MKLTIHIIIIFFVFSCGFSSENDSNQTQDLSKEEPPIFNLELEQDQRINLEETLSETHNNYLASFSEGHLSFCCYDILDVSESIFYASFERSIEVYKNENKEDTVNVFTSATSFYKEYYNDHPRVDELVLISGAIKEASLLNHRWVKIGMDKSEFLEQLFYPSVYFDSIQKVSISEDELGNAETVYLFEENKLAEIQFESGYDWIK